MELKNLLSKYHNYQRTLRIIVLIISLALPFCVLSTSQETDTMINSSLYQELNTIDSETLLKEAEDNFLKDTLLARAAMALTVVANRYYNSPKDTNIRRSAVKALEKLGNFYYINALDFNKAYKYLATAQQIAEEDNDQKELAIIYQSLSTLFHNSDINDNLSPKVRNFMIKGMDAAINSDNWTAMVLISLGMTTSAFNEGSWGDFYAPINRFASYPKKENFKYHEFIQLTIEAGNAYLEGDYDKAESILIESKTLLNSSMTQIEIFKLTVDGWLTSIAHKKGDYKKAIALSRNMLAHTDSLQWPIYELDVYNSLKKLYSETNRPDSADYYYDKFLRTKDWLESSIGYGNIEKLEFLSEIDKINSDVEQLSLRRQEERRVRIIVTSVLIVVVVILLALLWGYINLRRHHHDLFKRNEEMMRMAAQYKLLREQWEEERKNSKDENESLSTQSLLNANEEATNNQEHDVSDNEELKRIYARVLAVMEGSRAIFEPGFSLYDLSKIVKVSVRNVSKAINACHYTNFPQLLNEFRIREVMRIMHSGEANNFTIEGIAEKAGFKSRTSFSTLFKKTTGLTPAEYRKMASTQSTPHNHSHNNEI